MLLDGYFKIFKINTIYLSIGEWFLGALIIIHFLYPIILYGFKNLFIQTLLIDIFFFSFLIHGKYFIFYEKNIIIV